MSGLFRGIGDFAPAKILTVLDPAASWMGEAGYCVPLVGSMLCIAAVHVQVEEQSELVVEMQIQ
jgi:hypothetical protein